MSDRFLSVEGAPGFVRDTETNAILNRNRSEIELAQERKRLRNIKKQEDLEIQNTVNNLQKDIAEIKSALNLLLSRSI
jgi:coenzyme F420-reducing hydrogenase delta subunit|tara:strand:+ start:245 stop:478 length:234 start_codon:yes stop_codon:yes gene_type:complete